jgi:ketosteroid isomerase-like protein
VRLETASVADHTLARSPLHQFWSVAMSDSKQVIADLFKAFASRDEARIRECFVPEATWSAPPNNATAAAFGHLAGAEDAAAIAHFIAVDFPRLFVSNVQSDVRVMVADGKIVVTEYRLRATLVNSRHYNNDLFLEELLALNLERR